jgi:hypothetical protein
MTERNWHEDIDRNLADCSSIALIAKSMLWHIFSTLTGLNTFSDGFSGAPYTLDQCCDSTQVKTDGTNLFGTTFDAAKWVRGGTSAAKSWFVLTDGTYYLTVSYQGSSDYTSFATYYWSKIRPSGGTTTVRPTAADMTSDAVNTISFDNAINSWKAQTLVSDSGDFWFLFGKNASGVVQTYFGSNHIVKDPANIRTMAWDMWANSGYVNTGLALSAFTSGWKFRSYDNLLAGVGGVVTPNHNGTTQTMDLIAAGGDFYTGLPMRMPILVFHNETNRVGFPGHLPDVEWGPENASPRGREAGGPPYAAVLLGPIWFPFKSLPTL